MRPKEKVGNILQFSYFLQIQWKDQNQQQIDPTKRVRFESVPGTSCCRYSLKLQKCIIATENSPQETHVVLLFELG